MREAMKIILKGHAKEFFARHTHTLQTYYDGVGFVLSRYNNTGKQNLHLAEWKGMRLSNEMHDNPNASEVSVFQQLVNRAM